jgi:ribosomal protein S27AE
VIEVVERKDKIKAPQCPECGTFMDKITAWVCSKCGKKTKK